MILIISSIVSIICVIIAFIFAASYFDFGVDDAERKAYAVIFWIALIILACTCLFGFVILGNSEQSGEPEITYVYPSDLAIGEKHLFVKLDTVLRKDRTYDSNVYADIMAAKEKHLMMRVDTRRNSYGAVIMEIVDFVSTNITTNAVPELVLEKK